MCGDRGTRGGRPSAEDRGVAPIPAREITIEEDDVVRARMEYPWRGHVFRVGDRSGSYRIIRIDEDYRGVVTLRTERIGSGSGPRYMYETPWSWYLRIRTHGVVQATRAVYQAGVAETRGFIAVGEVLSPPQAIVSQAIWTSAIMRSYRDRIDRVLSDVAEINPILRWLHLHAPTSVEVFLVGRLRASVDATAPSPMNVTDISRFLTRTLRDVNSFVEFIRFLRLSGSSIRGFTRVRGVSGTTVTLVRFISSTARQLLRGPLRERIRLVQSFVPIIVRARSAIRGATAASRIRRQTEQTFRRELRAQTIEQVTQWAQDNNITTRGGALDRLIREHSNPRVATNIIRILNIVRDTLVLCTDISDDITMERASGSGRMQSEAW